MTCQWDAGRETHLETNFTLKSEWQVPFSRSGLRSPSWALVLELSFGQLAHCVQVVAHFA